MQPPGKFVVHVITGARRIYLNTNLKRWSRRVPHHASRLLTPVSRPAGQHRRRAYRRWCGTTATRGPTPPSCPSRTPRAAPWAPRAGCPARATAPARRPPARSPRRSAAPPSPRPHKRSRATRYRSSNRSRGCVGFAATATRSRPTSRPAPAAGATAATRAPPPPTWAPDFSPPPDLPCHAPRHSQGACL